MKKIQSSAEGDDPGTMGGQVPLTPEQAAELKEVEKRWKTMNHHQRRVAEAKIRKWLRKNAKKKTV